jgi:LysR family transcriptional regulator (chromosome initiation inhibitor)
VQLDPGQLAALMAVVDHGSFEAAANHLHVTPSAISQRIKALETAVGHVVVRRGTPSTATQTGQLLLRLARQTALLQAEVLRELGGSAAGGSEAAGTKLDVALAVNADSLATWFRDVLAEAADWEGTTLRLRVDDQAYSAGLLRGGDVLGAVTSEPRAVQGCSVSALGSLRYLPACSPAFAERWRSRRGPDWAKMPTVRFNDKDLLQQELLVGRGVLEQPPTHQVPTSREFLEAVRLGLGWGAIPEPQLEPDMASGRLVPLSSRQHVDVELYWQRWRIESLVLDRVGNAIHRAAARHLRPLRSSPVA